jgi:hypothetical protein
MQSRFTLLFFFSMSICLFSYAQENCENIRFQKVFKITPSSSPADILSTRDGGYLLTGRQSEESVGNGDGLLLKLNKYGEREWVRAYNRTDADFRFSSSTQLPDGSVVTIVDMHDGGSAIQKTDENGNLLWQRKLSSAIGAITLYKVIAYADGSFAVAGSVQQSTFEGSTVIIKFDTNGNQQWIKYWNNGNHFNFPSSLLMKGDLLLVSGIIPAVEPGTADTAYVVKMSALNGEIFLSTKFWNGTDRVGNNSLVKRTNGTFVLASDYFDENTGIVRTSLTHLSENLEISRQLASTVNNSSSSINVSATNDNGVSITFFNPADQLNSLVKFGSDFNVVFAKGYPQSIAGNISAPFTTLLQAADNGFVIGGNVLSSETSDIWLLKTDANGKTANCQTQSVNIATEPISVYSEVFGWNIVEINPEISQEDLSVPDITPIDNVQTLCFSTSCTPDCNLSCSIKSSPENSTYTGGNPNIIYLGYGSQRTSLSVVTESTGVLTYNWEGNGILSCNSCADPVFAPSAPGTYQFTVTITDESGCTSSCSISICVQDIRSESRESGKVYLCHVPPGNTGNPQQISISVDAVAAHLLNHPGDKLGICGQSPCGNKVSGGVTPGNLTVVPADDKNVTISIYPNPAYDHIFVKLSNSSFKEFSVKLMSADYKLVASGKYQGAVNEIRFDSRLAPGVYFLEVTIGNRREVFKVLKHR